MPPVKGSTYFTKVKAARPSEATARKRSMRLLIILLIAAICGPIALLFTMLGSGGKTVVPKVQPLGRQVADLTVQQAVAGQPIQIPTASTLSNRDLDAPKITDSKSETTVRLPYSVSAVTWTKFQTVNPAVGENSLGRFEIHSYLLVPSSAKSSGAALVNGLPDRKTQKRDLESDPKTRYDIDQSATDQYGEPRLVPQVMKVTVLIDPATKKPYLAAAPSLEPYTDSSERSEGYGDYSNLPSRAQLQATQPLSNAVGKWAKAYVEDDRAALLEVTADLNKSRKYLGLGNLSLTEDAGDAIKILTASKVDANTAVLRVRIKAQDASVTSEAKKPSIQTLDYDLLVKNQDSGQPSIVAWGPPGSGFLLKPYSNGILQKSALTQGTGEGGADNGNSGNKSGAK